MQVRDVTFVVVIKFVEILAWGDRTLVNTHRVRERTAEQVIEAFRDLRQNLCEGGLLWGCEMVDRWYVSVVRKH
jgi:hypothetical protein